MWHKIRRKFGRRKSGGGLALIDDEEANKSLDITSQNSNIEQEHENQKIEKESLKEESEQNDEVIEDIQGDDENNSSILEDEIPVDKKQKNNKFLNAIKKHKKIYIIMAVIVFVSICVIASQYFKCTDEKIAKVNDLIEKYEFEEAYDTYSHLWGIKEEDENKVAEQYNLTLRDINSQYFNGKLSYGKVKKYFEGAKVFSKVAVEFKYDTIKNEFVIIHQDKKNYHIGLKYFKQKKYWQAYKTFFSISSKNRKIASKEILKCTDVLVKRLIKKSNYYLKRKQFKKARIALEGYESSFVNNDKVLEQSSKINDAEFEKPNKHDYYYDSYDENDYDEKEYKPDLELKNIESTCSGGYAKTKLKITNNTSDTIYEYVKVRVTYYSDKACKNMITYDETYAVASDALYHGDSKIFTSMSEVGGYDYYWYRYEVIDYNY